MICKFFSSPLSCGRGVGGEGSFTTDARNAIVINEILNINKRATHLQRLQTMVKYARCKGERPYNPTN